jgi:hypothetical protein
MAQIGLKFCKRLNKLCAAAFYWIKFGNKINQYILQSRSHCGLRGKGEVNPQLESKGKKASLTLNSANSEPNYFGVKNNQLGFSSLY